MLVAKMFLMILFFAMSVVSEGTGYSYPLRVLRSSDDTMQEEVEYFEQCSFVNLWKEHLGRVNVLTFLDPTWQYSFRQAVMLKLLSSRLRKSGFPDIRFFVIAPLHDLTEDKTEDDDEIETWREIAAMFEKDPDINDFFTTEDNEPEIIYLEDEFRIWEKFRASKNQVVIIDRCGQLTYHVIVPWSILYFPYVKAAILSTYKEDPCGGCDPTKYQALNHEDYFSDLKSTTPKKVDPLEIDDNVDADLFWTTEQSSKNDSIIEESLTDKHETNTISPIISDKITHDSDDPLKFSNMTDASVVSETVTYGYDNVTTESSPDEDPKETSRRKDSSTTSKNNATSATLDLQQEVSPTQDESTSMSDNSISGEIKNESTTNEVKDEFISTTKTTIADIVAGNDEIPDGGVDALTTDNNDYEPNDSFDNNNCEFRRMGVDRGGKRHLSLLGISKNTEAELSLHVIMRAPHVHGNGRKTRKHTYLMLKIGDPDFHEHPDTGIDATSSTTLWRDTDPQVANSENNDSETTEMNEQNTDQIYTFDKDESPGLYGEIADFWRDNNNDADSNESLDNDTHNNSTTSYNEKHHTNASDQATTSSESSETDENYSTTNITTNINSTNPQNTVRVDETDSSESISGNNENNKEEMRNNLIKHYNKLLSWIRYRLIK